MAVLGFEPRLSATRSCKSLGQNNMRNNVICAECVHFYHSDNPKEGELTSGHGMKVFFSPAQTGYCWNGRPSVPAFSESVMSSVCVTSSNSVTHQEIHFQTNTTDEKSIWEASENKTNQWRATSSSSCKQVQLGVIQQGEWEGWHEEPLCTQLQTLLCNRLMQRCQIDYFWHNQ
jgi:hypothetical protein